MNITGMRPAYSRPASVRFAGNHAENFRIRVANDFSYRAWENARGTGFEKTLASQLASVRVAQELKDPRYSHRFPGDTPEAIESRAKERHYTLVGYYRDMLKKRGLGDLASFQAQDLAQYDRWRQTLEGVLAPLVEPPYEPGSLN